MAASSVRMQTKSMPAMYRNQKPLFTLNQQGATTHVMLRKPTAARSQCMDRKVNVRAGQAPKIVSSTVMAPAISGVDALTMRAKQAETMGVQAVILDLDGVILDYEGAANHALNDALRKYNKSGNVGVDWTLHSKIMGLRIQETASVVLDSNRLLDRVDPEKFIQRYYENMEPLYTDLKLHEGAEEMIKSFKAKGIPMALATSSSRASMERKMTNYQHILDMFDCVITGDDASVNFGKKSPEMFLLAAERMQADPKKCLVLDDSPIAVASAKAAGMYVASVPDPQNRFTQDFTNGGPDFEVKSLKEFAKTEGIQKDELKRVVSSDLPKAEFNDMPLSVGFGTDLIHTATDGSLTCDDKILQAINAGYTLIDTATKYESEPDTGRAIKEAIANGMKREDFYVVTKVWVNDMGYASAIESVEKSLRRLQMDYVDLVLIHWPGPAPGKPDAQQFGFENKAKRTLTWRALEEMVRRGKVKSIGVANWTIRHLKETLSVAEIPPTVNQVEMHPYYTRTRLLNFCTDHGIKLMGYSPFGRGRLNIINDPVMGEIGSKYDKSGAQVILRWMIQRGVVPLPRASSENRIKQNFDIFDFKLTDDEMATIDKLNGDKRSCSIDCHSIP
uniref:NADP-dependent oxidoreductase domain-containing protein n=1 Tax=Lotharella globosa TaxID=91324 RepID=A0A6V3QYU2_9EUKA